MKNQLDHFLLILYIFIDLLYLLSDNTGGHVAHLSGSVVGFIFAMLMKKGIDISAIFIFKKKKNTTFKKVYKNKPEKKYQSVRVSDVNFTQRQIDEILEKQDKIILGKLLNLKEEEITKIQLIRSKLIKNRLKIKKWEVSARIEKVSHKVIIEKTEHNCK